MPVRRGRKMTNDNYVNLIFLRAPKRVVLALSGVHIEMQNACSFCVFIPACCDIAVVLKGMRLSGKVLGLM